MRCRFLDDGAAETTITHIKNRVLTWRNCTLPLAEADGEPAVCQRDKFCLLIWLAVANFDLAAQGLAVIYTRRCLADPARIAGY
jgi:hypothetical protein